MKALLFICMLLFLCADLHAEQVNSEPAVEGVISQKEDIPFRKESVVDVSYFGKLIFVLVILLSLAALVLVILNRLGFGIARSSSNEQRFRLLEVKRLTTKTTLFYLEVNESPLILAQCGDSLTIINKKDWGSEE